MEEIIKHFSLPSEYTYCKPSETSDTFRVKEIVDQQSAEKWLITLQANSLITWRIARTYPASSRINIYKVDFRCQHLTDKRATTQRKNTNCPAKLHIVVKRFVKKSRSKNVDPLNEMFPCIVNFQGSHNHTVDTAAALKYRDLCEETKNKLSSLFRRGHSAASALHFLKTDYLLEHGDNYYKYAADSYYIPSESVVHKLFCKEFNNEYGDMSGMEMFKSLESLLELYNKNTEDGCAEFHRTSNAEHYYVIICTPIMKRAHQKLVQSKELVLVDAAGGLERQNHRIYCLITPTAAGGVPLGIIITDTETIDVFTEAILCLKKILAECSFFYQGYPQVFLTDNDLKERKPLQIAFPESTLLLCQFHICKAVWAWILNSKNKIEGCDRQELYYLFKNILYASTEIQAEEKYSMLCYAPVATKYPHFVKYIQKMWQNKEDCISYCRHQLPLRGSNTTNYVEIVFRILKECIFDRIMAFNLTQMVDYIINKYELYMEKRLIDFANGRYSKSVYKNLMSRDETIDPTLVKPLLHRPGSFKVKSQKLDTFSDVDITAGFCSCTVGQSGTFCKHASAVMALLDSEVSSAYKVVTVSTKEFMYFVATGAALPSTWLQPLCITEINLEKNVFPQDNKNTHDSEENTEQKKCCHFQEKENSTDEMSLSSDEILKFKQILMKMENGIKADPLIFVPAARKMIKNYDSFAQTDNALASAMHTFAKYSGLPPKKRKGPNVSGKQIRYGTRRIGVQPTAIARRVKNAVGKRKSLLSGKNKSSGCHTSQKHKRNDTKEHDYTPLFGSLPKKRRKAPHNLQNCVYGNHALGGI